MRYRIIIELDTEGNHMSVNRLAVNMKDLAVTSWSNPVYLSTEKLDQIVLYAKGKPE